MIIIIISIILLLLTSFLYIQKKKVMSLQQQICDLQNKISILEKQYLVAEQYNDSLRQEANTVHLYASLSLEEAKKTSIKDKQSQSSVPVNISSSYLITKNFSAAAMSHYFM